MLSIIVAAIALAIAIAINSRNQRFKDEKYDIDIAVNIWEDGYKDDTHSWNPVIFNNDYQQFPISESNNPDFSGRYKSLNSYNVVKYHSDDIKNIIHNQTQIIIRDPDNGEFNLTSPITINFPSNYSLTLNDIPFYSRIRSERSSKDWNLNRVGVWNSTDGICYVFKQLTHLCLIINHDNFPYLIHNYTTFPCDEINRSYASFVFYGWTDPDSNPSFSNFKSQYNMSLTIRSSKDPYVVGYTTVDIVKDKENNKKLLWGLLLGFGCILLLIIPIKLINTEDEYVPYSNKDNVKFMKRM